MNPVIRVIVLNADPAAAPELRAYLLGIPDVKIAAELDEPALLPQTLDQFPAEVLLVHLDPDPAGLLARLAPLLEPRKDQLATIGLTENRDAELVVHALRAGMREFLWKPVPPDQLAAILQRVAAAAAGSGRRLGRLIPVLASCGGVGATTLACNLAVELAQLKEWHGAPPAGARPRVAAVDLDFRFGQLAMFLDAQPTYTLADLCESPERIEPQMIERVMVKHPAGVHVLAHPADLDRAERLSAAHAAAALAALQEHYDFIVTDGPPRFDHTARAVLDMTDVCLLVLQLLVPSVRSADRLLHELARRGYNLDRVRLVCNRFGRDAGYLEPPDVETTLGRKLTWFLPDDWKTSSTAVNVGAPLLDFAPKSRLRAAYREIAQALAQAVPGDEPVVPPEDNPPAEAPRRGLLSSIFATQRTQGVQG